MVGGLAEREALRSALGTYVDPRRRRSAPRRGRDPHGRRDRRDGHVRRHRRLQRARRDHAGRDRVQRSSTSSSVSSSRSSRTTADTRTSSSVTVCIAVFGTPMKLDDHADRACDAACSIERTTRRSVTGERSGRASASTRGSVDGRDDGRRIEARLHAHRRCGERRVACRSTHTSDRRRHPHHRSDEGCAARAGHRALVARYRDRPRTERTRIALRSGLAHPGLTNVRTTVRRGRPIEELVRGGSVPVARRRLGRVRLRPRPASRFLSRRAGRSIR